MNELLAPQQGTQVGQPTIDPQMQPTGPVQAPTAPQGQPMEGQAPDAPVGQTQVPRDYASNPLGLEDKDDLDEFSILATKLINSPETREKVLSRIQKREHPFKEIASASLVVMDRLEQHAKDQGKPWDKAVAVLGLVNITSQISDLAVASNKVKEPIEPEQKKLIFAESMKRYVKKKIKTGEITQKEAAKMAHQGALSQGAKGGADVEGSQAKLAATQEKQNAAANAPKNASNGMLEAPAPEEDPMNPSTTMKEVLANGQGGLLNG
jgi:galactitol-specific phosphotransferase system IIB component